MKRASGAAAVCGAGAAAVGAATPADAETDAADADADAADVQPQTSIHTVRDLSLPFNKAYPQGSDYHLTDTLPTVPLLILSHLHLPQASGRHPQPFPISSFPYTAPFPVRSTSPPQLFLCMQRPTRMRLACLGACIVIFPEAEKVPSGPWNHRSLRGAFTLLGPDFIYQISL